MSFDIKKFFSGFNIFDGQALGKIIFFGILICVGLAIYHQLTRPTQNIIAKKGSNVVINTPEKKGLFETFGEPFIQIDTKGEIVGGLRCGLRF